MNEIAGIYKIQNLINNKIYIGQSINIEYRFYQHKHTKDKYYIHRAIQKYGETNFSFEILEKNLYSRELRNQREIYWINFYNSLVPNGYNLTKGGDNIAESKKSSVKQFSLKGEYIQTFDNATVASKILNIDRSNITKVCQNKGIMKSAGGYIWRYEEDSSQVLPVKAKGKKVFQYDIQTKELIAEYNSISEVARKFGVAPNNISKGIKKPSQIYKNYYWQIIEE